MRTLFHRGSISCNILCSKKLLHSVNCFYKLGPKLFTQMAIVYTERLVLILKNIHHVYFNSPPEKHGMFTYQNLIIGLI